jgi:hypothetical protein
MRKIGGDIVMVSVKSGKLGSKIVTVKLNDNESLQREYIVKVNALSDAGYIRSMIKRGENPAATCKRLGDYKAVAAAKNEQANSIKSDGLSNEQASDGKVSYYISSAIPGMDKPHLIPRKGDIFEAHGLYWLWCFDKGKAVITEPQSGLSISVGKTFEDAEKSLYSVIESAGGVESFMNLVWDKMKQMGLHEPVNDIDQILICKRN